MVRIRDRTWVVADIARSQLPPDVFASANGAQHLVELTSVEDDGYGDELRVIWEIEPGRAVLRSATLPDPTLGRLDAPERLDAFLDAVRWGAIASADTRALQAPFRSGIEIEDYQLDPVVRALRTPRVNLLIADDVGLGKTIEAGLVAQELLLRHRARSILVVCPASLCIKWRTEMAERFGLEFRIVDAELLRQLRRERGVSANPWTHFPRLIVSIDWLKSPRALARLEEVLPTDPTTYPRRFDLLIVDEVHNAAPAGRGRYATDSRRTKVIRRLAPYFEHRLFLSATPHNGYTESFTALLEMLDPQRFTRGVRPPDDVLWQVMVRRLKSELPPREDGSPRFPARRIEALEVAFTPDEERVHETLTRYSEVLRRAARTDTSRRAIDFVLLLLKKRLLSSPAAFRETLAVHRASLGRREGARVAEIRDLTLAFDRLDDEVADEQDLADATEDALRLAGATAETPGIEAARLLEEMSAWAAVAGGRADSKATRLLEQLDGTCRPLSEDRVRRWNDERVIVFTEYRDTQAWLQTLLTAHGLGAERLELLYGGMNPEHRERIRDAFQTHPSISPVRILLATDAASEGIDLQRHCHRVIHFEIPFSPTRMEQRNGRVDRYGQRATEILIHHFVGRGWEQARAGSLVGDLQFLRLVAMKVDNIRVDLGSAGPILQRQVEEAMLGRRISIDEGPIAAPGRAAQLVRLERNLRDEIARLREQLETSRVDLGISPGSVERVTRTGLELARQPPLVPSILERPGVGIVDGFRVGALTGSWARAAADVPHPVTNQLRPVVFDRAAADGHDDVVLAHLGHPLVLQASRLLRAEIWASEPKLARATARLTDAEGFDSPVVVAHARLVITSAEGHRLHEELITTGGRVRNGRFARLNVGETRNVLASASDQEPPDRWVREVTEAWPAVSEALRTAIDLRGREVAESVERRLAERAEADADRIGEVLGDLGRRIRTRLNEVERGGEQMRLFDPEETAQFERDVEALRRRLDEIPSEIEREIGAIAQRYQTPVPRTFPAAVTILVPRLLVDGPAWR